MPSSLPCIEGKYHRVTEPSDGVAMLEFNRPPVNAFHDDMWLELQAIVEKISQSDIRVIVLSSTSDKYFTAGLDLNSTSSLTNSGLDPARQAFHLRQHILDFQAAISSLSNARQPVIAAMHGLALGLAVDIASACDVRLAAADTTLGIMEVDVGLAADIGTLQRFPKITGNDSKARELALTGRKFSAEEAKEIGFVSEVVQGGRKEVIARALGMAKTIVSKSPVAVISTKHLINHARDHSIQEGLEYTAAWNMSMLQSEDTLSSMKAVLAKSKPVYASLSGIKAKL